MAFIFTQERSFQQTWTYKKVQSISIVNNPSHTVVKKQCDALFSLTSNLKSSYLMLYCIMLIKTQQRFVYAVQQCVCVCVCNLTSADRACDIHSEHSEGEGKCNTCRNIDKFSHSATKNIHSHINKGSDMHQFTTKIIHCSASTKVHSMKPKPFLN